MRYYVLGSLAAVALLVVSSVAEAQGPGGFGGRGFGGGGGSRTGLLQMTEVQKELELVADQVEKIKTLAAEARPDQNFFQGFRDLSEDDRRAKIDELRKKGEEVTKKINDVLLPHQKTRLDQLVVQSQLRFGGLERNEELSKTLNITEDQKKKLTEVSEKVNKETEEKVSKLRADARKQVLAEVLTSEQRAQYEKMVGEPFSFPRQTGFGGQGGPGGGGPGGRGPGGQGGQGGRGGRGGRGGNNGGAGNRPAA